MINESSRNMQGSSKRRVFKMYCWCLSPLLRLHRKLLLAQLCWNELKQYSSPRRSAEPELCGAISLSHTHTHTPTARSTNGPHTHHGAGWTQSLELLRLHHEVTHSRTPGSFCWRPGGKQQSWSTHTHRHTQKQQHGGRWVWTFSTKSFV